MADLFLRKAQFDDVDLIFKWANDPEARKNSFNSNPIPYEDHVRWFESRMKSKDSYIFVMMEGDIPVGQCRLDVKNGEGMISYSVDSNFRGRGFGKKMLELLCREADSIEGLKCLAGEVKPDNIPSGKVFLSLNFKEETCGENGTEVLKYVLKI